MSSRRIVAGVPRTAPVPSKDNTTVVDRKIEPNSVLSQSCKCSRDPCPSPVGHSVTLFFIQDVVPMWIELAVKWLVVQ